MKIFCNSNAKLDLATHSPGVASAAVADFIVHTLKRFLLGKDAARNRVFRIRHEAETKGKKRRHDIFYNKTSQYAK